MEHQLSPAPEHPGTGTSLAVQLLRRKESGIFFALLGLMVLITLKNEDFATIDNLSSICRQVAYIAIAAMGVFFVIVTGGIDLSIAGTVAMSGVMCGWMMASAQHRYLPLLEWGPAAAIPIGLLAGSLVGAFNGYIVCYLGVTPFIVTLGSMWMVKGLVEVLTGGESLLGIPSRYIEVGNWIFFPIIVMAVVATVSHVVLTYTPFGRRLYAVGGNEEATRLSGINVRQVKFLAYVISGALCGIAGILYVAKFRSALAEPHQGMELDAIAAAVIGGTSLMGGEGSVAGVLLGAMIMGVIRNGLVLAKIDSHWQPFIIGSIVVLAAILDVWRSRRK